MYQDARDLNIFSRNQYTLVFSNEDVHNDPITRYEMAKIMIRISDILLKEKSLDTLGVANSIADFADIKKQDTSYYVEQAFAKGLITGYTNGTFGGDKTGTRAEAAVMVSRMLDVQQRKKVDISKVQLNEGEISLGNPFRPLAPKAGDLVVKADGTKVTLQVGPSGVLGEGQGVDYYSGIRFANGNVFEDGDYPTKAMGYNDMYIIDFKTGEGHFREQWNKIGDYYYDVAHNIKNPKEGQVVANCYMYYKGQWYWVRPSL